MPVGLDAQMMFQVPRALSDEELERLNHDVVRTFFSPLGIRGVEDQRTRRAIEKTSSVDFGTLDRPQSGEECRIPRHHQKGVWYWVHLFGRYYGKGYENGDVWGYVGIAEWLEFRLPGVEVWYGSDADEYLKAFSKACREELVKHFFTVGHGTFANP